MRGRLLGVMGVVAVGAWVSDCGPPPVPLTGWVHYNTGCSNVNPCPSNEVYVAESTTGMGVPPAVVSCAVSPPASNGHTRLRFTIGRSQSGSLTEGEGISLCGEVAGPNQEMVNTRLAIYFSGDSSPNIAVPGVCHVGIGSLGDSAFDGTISCVDAPTQIVPPRFRYILGVQGGPNPTADPAKGEFHFVSCTQLTTPCPS